MIEDRRQQIEDRGYGINRKEVRGIEDRGYSIYMGCCIDD